MTVHSTLGTILFIAAMLLGLRILVSWLIETPRWQRRFYPRWANTCCIPRRAMTRRQLVELAANRQPLQIVRTTLALWLLFGATACYGRFAWLKAGAAMLTILILMLFFALSSLRDGVLPMAELYRHRDFDRHFASRSFRYVDGAWQYADEDWFIRIGGSAAGIWDVDTAVGIKNSLGIGVMISSAEKGWPNPARRRGGPTRFRRLDCTAWRKDQPVIKGQFAVKFPSAVAQGRDLLYNRTRAR